MATHTQIIEFFGLPGCGKTTLCDLLVAQREDDGGRTVRMSDIGAHYHAASLMTKVQSIPFCTWWLIARLLFTLPRIPLKKWRLYRSFFYISMMYNFCHRQRSADYMVVDHGLMQAVVSVMFGHASDLTPRGWQLLRRICTRLGVDKMVWCDLPVGVSMTRIRKRGRRGNGRLDEIESDEQLLAVLHQQAKFFRKEHDMASQIAGTQTVTINTDKDIAFLVEECKTKVL